jgi:hypothetical protein
MPLGPAWILDEIGHCSKKPALVQFKAGLFFPGFWRLFVAVICCGFLLAPLKDPPKEPF